MNKIKITGEYIKEYIENLTDRDLALKSRKRELVNSRIVAFKLAKTFTKDSLSKMATLYNKKDHVTVSYNVKQFHILKDDNEFEEYYDIYDHCFNHFIEVSDSKIKPRKVVRVNKKANELKLNDAQKLLSDIPNYRMQEMIDMITLRQKSWEWKSKDSTKIYTAC